MINTINVYPIFSAGYVLIIKIDVFMFLGIIRIKECLK